MAQTAQTVTHPAPLPIDFQVQNCGSIVLLIPQTEAADDFVEAHLSHAMRFNRAVVVEPRYVAAIIEGASDEGLTFE